MMSKNQWSIRTIGSCDTVGDQGPKMENILYVVVMVDIYLTVSII